MTKILVDGAPERGIDELVAGIELAQATDPSLSFVVVGPNNPRTARTEFIDSPSLQQSVDSQLEFDNSLSRNELLSPEKLVKSISRGYRLNGNNGLHRTNLHVMHELLSGDASIDGVVYLCDTRAVVIHLRHGLRKGKLEPVLTTMGPKDAGAQWDSGIYLGADVLSPGSTDHRAFVPDLGVTQPESVGLHDYMSMAVLGTATQVARDRDAEISFLGIASELYKQREDVQRAFDMVQRNVELDIDEVPFVEPNIIVSSTDATPDIIIGYGEMTNTMLKSLGGMYRLRSKAGIVGDHLAWRWEKMRGREIGPDPIVLGKVAKELYDQGAFVLGVDFPGERTYVGVRPHGSSRFGQIAGAILRAADASRGFMTTVNYEARRRNRGVSAQLNE